jgi:hypothetical protein
LTDRGGERAPRPAGAWGGADPRSAASVGLEHLLVTRVRDASRPESALVAPQEPGQPFQVDAVNQRIRVSMHELPLRLS